jgi:Zn-dependent protease with chaperone function
VSLGFFVLFLGVPALVVILTSACVAVAVAFTGQRLTRLAPAAQARVLLGAALAPSFAGLLTLSGWLADEVLFHCTAHHCLIDNASAEPAPWLLLCVCLLASRVALAGARSVASMRRSRELSGALALDASELGPDVSLLPGDEPQAFVLGLFRPRVYVSRGMAAAVDADGLEAVLAHERAHRRRRDPLRRWVASLGLAFHLPGVAGMLERRLARAHEAAADADAARAVGDGARIAQVLVRVARLRLPQPVAVCGLLGGDLSARVGDLLATERRSSRPSALLLASGALTLWMLSIAAADPIHRLAETLLGLLHR